MIQFHPVISADWLLPPMLIRGNTAVGMSQHSFKTCALSLSLSSTAESRFQRYNVKEPPICLTPQLTSDAHHAHRSSHAPFPDAPGAQRSQSSQRAQHGRHAQTPHRQILHALVLRFVEAFFFVLVCSDELFMQIRLKSNHQYSMNFNYRQI